MVASRQRWLYVEGGGDNSALKSECRKAFSKLLDAAGIARKPRVVVCGPRRAAYEKFCEAHEAGDGTVWLLVDAEENAPAGPPFEPWKHVRDRNGDRWERPSGANDEQLHLMNVTMEAWLLADVEALRRVFRKGFDDPTVNRPLESISKGEVYSLLNTCAKRTSSGGYSKAKHSFSVLAQLSPEALSKLSWGKRFLEAMQD